MIKSRYFFIISLFFIFSGFLQANDTVKLQLKWFHSFQFAGYYMAKEKGFYDEVNLNVNIMQRDPSKNNVEQVIEGEAEYGIADSAVLLYRAKGAPLRIIASVFQHAPLVFISKRSSGIVSPFEMKNKIISYQRGLDDAPLLAMLESAKIKEEDYIYAPLDFTSQEFIDSKVDVMSAYLSDQPFFLKEQNIDVNIINPLNYGIDFYGDNIFTTEQEINKNPVRVKAFRDASIKGWHYALENIDETIKIIREKYDTTRSYEYLKHEALVTKDMILADSVELGSTSLQRFYRIVDIYERIGKEKRNHLDRALKGLIYDTDKEENQWIEFFYLVLSLLVLVLVIVLMLFLLNQRLKILVEQKTQEQKNLLSLFEYGDSVLFKWANDEHWSIKYVSSNVANLLGYTQEEFLSSKISYAECIHKDDLVKVMQEVQYNLQLNGEFFKHEPYRLITKNGSVKWVLDYTVFEKDTDDDVVNFLGYLVDITERENILHNLEKFINTQENIVFLTNAKEVTFANKKFFDFFGYKDLINFKKKHSCICELFIENEDFFHLGKIERKINWIEEMQNLSHSEQIVSMKNDKDEIHAFSFIFNKFDENLHIVSLTDISQAMVKNIELEKKVIRDNLTGAFNREYFEKNYKRIIKECEASNQNLSIALLDIDHFKVVNDTYGHDVGDGVLKLFVETIQKYLRFEDTLIRWGGEEFILMLKVKSAIDLEKILENIREFIAAKEYPIVGHKTCSIGGTIYQKDEDINKTIKRADEAVYKAKMNGRNQVVIF